MVGSKKEYIFNVKFGSRTSTADAEGEVIESTDVTPSQEQAKEAVKNFIGKIQQRPPKYSAIKIDGKRAYDLARKGKEFELPLREVEIYEFEMIKFTEDYAQYRCLCSKGTYIRSLAEDIASSIGSLGYVTYLKRARVGCFYEEGSVDTASMDIKNILPTQIVLPGFVKRIDISQLEARKILNGIKININSDEPLVAIYCEDKFFGLMKTDGEKGTNIILS